MARGQNKGLNIQNMALKTRKENSNECSMYKYVTLLNTWTKMCDTHHVNVLVRFKPSSCSLPYYMHVYKLSKGICVIGECQFGYWFHCGLGENYNTTMCAQCITY